MKKGFTLIEVALFIAISAALFIGIGVGIFRLSSGRRYEESVRDFADFLRGNYQAVSNVRNDGTGNSDKAIYGRIVVFGDQDGQTVHTYDVVGDAVSGDGISRYTIANALTNVNANILKTEKLSNNLYKVTPYNETSYRLEWDATVEDTDGNVFKGLFMIVRSPVSGSIHTYAKPSNDVDITEYFRTSSSKDVPNPLHEIFGNNFNDLNSMIEDVNLCINSPDTPDGIRRNIFVAAGGRNSSAVDIISLDSGDNECAN